jgi:transcriptional regulator with XRE-family HTH domain
MHCQIAENDTIIVTSIMTIGERLEEARKRKGVSIREAAEATKIRGDYLLSMEDNSFEINLPEIYVRGFLRNYASFLKMDDDKIIHEYDTLRMQGLSKSERKVAQLTKQASSVDEEEPALPDTSAPTESLGRVDLPSNPTFGDSIDTDFDEEDDEESKGFLDYDKSIYLKVAAGLGAVVILILIVTLLVNLIGGDSPEINPEVNNTVVAAPENNPTNTQTPAQANVAQEGPDEVTFVALGRVMIIVEQKKDNKRLYQGTLAQGERVSVNADGPIQVRYDNGDNLMVERHGRSYRMGQSGLGYNSLP